MKIQLEKRSKQTKKTRISTCERFAKSGENTEINKQSDVKFWLN